MSRRQEGPPRHATRHATHDATHLQAFTNTRKQQGNRRGGTGNKTDCQKVWQSECLRDSPSVFTKEARALMQSSARRKTTCRMQSSPTRSCNLVLMQSGARRKTTCRTPRLYVSHLTFTSYNSPSRLTTRLRDLYSSTTIFGAEAPDRTRPSK